MQLNETQARKLMEYKGKLDNPRLRGQRQSMPGIYKRLFSFQKGKNRQGLLKRPGNIRSFTERKKSKRLVFCARLDKLPQAYSISGV